MTPHRRLAVVGALAVALVAGGCGSTTEPVASESGAAEPITSEPIATEPPVATAPPATEPAATPAPATTASAGAPATTVGASIELPPATVVDLISGAERQLGDTEAPTPLLVWFWAPH